MNKKDREKLICDEAIKLWRKKSNLTASHVSSPDQVIRNAKAVDHIYKTSHFEIVVEHTIVESFCGQLEDNCQFMELLGPLEEDLKGQLPTPGCFRLYVEVRAVKGAKKQKAIRKTIKEWILQKAPLLEIGSPKTAPRHVAKGIPDGVPFFLALYRWPGQKGSFRIGRSVPDNIEDLRSDRIRVALEAKLPKLAKAKGSDKVSVLVLESNDMALSNFNVVADAVVSQLSRIEDRLWPDYIYLVETALKPWWIYIIKEGSSIFPDTDGTSGYRVGAF